MSPFLVMPAIAVVLWLGHASLHAMGKRSAYRYTRWALFGGLAVTGVVFGLLAFQASNSVPQEWRDDASGGLVEFILAFETMLVVLALALLEVIHVAVAQTIEDARKRTDRSILAGTGSR